jgi:hypothetical protein
MKLVANAALIAALTLGAAMVHADPGRGASGNNEGGKHKGKGNEKAHLYTTATHRRSHADRRGRGQPDAGPATGSWFHQHGHSRLDVPPGHYPPPGLCRVWYPGRPPGHQPPPGDCLRLHYEAPAGAWLIGHPNDRRGRAHVSVYHDTAPVSGRRRPLVIGEFDLASGILDRVLADEYPFFDRD